MKLSELIQHVGDENVKFQVIDRDFVRGSIKKKYAEITLETEVALGQDLLQSIGTGSKTQKLGLLVWIPRDKMPENLRGM